MQEFNKCNKIGPIDFIDAFNIFIGISETPGGVFLAFSFKDFFKSSKFIV